jgi:solute carrier family 44 (choline transporter-like protein), member 2/4/5
MIPIIMTIITGFYTVYWGYSTLWIVSTGNLEPYPTEADSWLTKPFRSIEIDSALKKLLYVQGFGLFWNIAFLLTLSNFIINGAVCFWYHNTRNSTKHSISTTLWWALRYHIGSIAFGSFILSVIWVFRIIAEYLHQKHQQQKARGNENKMATFLLCCIKCILSVCQTLIRYINLHSYTEVILRGTNFCVSAKHGVVLVKRNLSRFIVLHGLGSVVMTFAKLFIIFVTLTLSYFALSIVYDFNNEEEQGGQINSMSAPLIVSFY